MEMIFGCLFTLILIAFLFFFCRNATITIKLEYPQMQEPDLSDLYNDEGDEKEPVKDSIDFDEMLNEVHDLMLDKEETDE